MKYRVSFVETSKAPSCKFSKSHRVASSSKKDFTRAKSFIRKDRMADIDEISMIASAPLNTSTSRNRKKSPPKSGSMAKRLGNILKTRANAKPNASDSSVGAVGDDATLYSAAGQQSLAPTVHSQNTVKASNRKAEPGTFEKHSPKVWKKLKRLVVGKREPSPTPENQNGSTNSSRTALDRSIRSSADSPTDMSAYPMKKRTFSADGTGTKSSIRSSQLDVAIRGRLDGIDILSLGPARMSSGPLREVNSQNSPSRKSSKTENEEDAKASVNIHPLEFSFTGLPMSCKGSELVSEMIWSSAGKDYPELMLEGYIPGGSDRWRVRLEEPHRIEVDQTLQHAPSTEHPSGDDDSTAVLTDDGSTNLPTNKLWDHIWGDERPPPAPAHMKTGDIGDDILELAASCSVPIDLDEDTFIIDCPDHLHSVHELAMIPMQGRRFESAIAILDRLLKGLKENSDSKLEHLIGCTQHNIGILRMCQGHFDEALKSFSNAVESRTQCLPSNHPDIAVSIMRQGEACFALDMLKTALECFETALGMSPNEDTTRAKILNNIGVVQYQCGRNTEALISFTSALQIQRQWLDGPVRREPIVYDASITLCNMGKVYLRMAEYDLAYSVFEEACLLRTTVFRKDHDLVLSSVENMVMVLLVQKDFAKSLLLLRSMLRSMESKYGPEDRRTIETMGYLGFLLCAKRLDVDEGNSHLTSVLKWQEKNLSASHSSLERTREMVRSLGQSLEGEFPY